MSGKWMSLKPAPGAPPGKAYIVGAGPGRKDLITVRGLELLRRADVVLYDRLVAPELLDEVRLDAERIPVGKQPGHHPVDQATIHRLLIHHVRAGKQVVRLKGGDPMVLGRGGEEALALRLAGLPYEIVPGVSSALAVPAYAGVPLTHRGLATGFAVVTGHECVTSSGTDWEALARIPTLVILMGVRRIPAIVERLLAAGRAPDTPAIAIQEGTTEAQRVVRAPLAELPLAMRAADLRSPAVIVVGPVVGLHELLGWFGPAGHAPGLHTSVEVAHVPAALDPDPA